MIHKLVIAAVIAALFYLGVFCNPLQFGLADLQISEPQNGYSPYTMFERCHPAEFHIPPGNC